MVCFCYQAPFGASLWIHTGSFRGLGADWGPWPGKGRKDPHLLPFTATIASLLARRRPKLRTTSNVSKTSRPQSLHQPVLCMHQSAGIPSVRTLPLVTVTSVCATAGCQAAAGAGQWCCLWGERWRSEDLHSSNRGLIGQIYNRYIHFIQH